MKRVIFDSYAFIAFFRGEEGGKTVKDILIKISKGAYAGFISAVNVGEVFYMISRKSSVKHAQSAIHAICQMPVEIVDPGLQLCLDAAAIKASHPLSYADAFAAALTVQLKGVLLTGDIEFEALLKVKDFKMKYL